jgi:two-component system phosphate regulon sensor histidine kinase PhoR
MAKPNCWEIMGCGRQPGGAKALASGVCPAADHEPAGPANGGEASGRMCWAVAGTYCEDQLQGMFATKHATCAECEVFKQVQHEEGASFSLLPTGPNAHRALLEQFTAIVSIVDSINGVVYVADFDDHALLYVNPYAEQLFGKNLVGRRCYEVLQSGQASPCSFCTNDRLIVDGEPGPPVTWEFENTVTKRWFLCIDRAIRWWDGRLVRMEVAIDVTDRKAAEQFRRQYVDLISHDLRNPLNAIILQAAVVRRSLERKGLAVESEAVADLVASARRMDAMIADLLETTRLESGHLELHKREVDLCAWVEEHAGRRLVSVEDRGRVGVRTEPAPVRVNADPARLDRVLENLLSNALKYSGDKGVTIEVRREGTDAVVSVRDQGVGIAAEELPRLFQRFYRATTAGSVKGLGLGLYHARLIVEEHGGRIWVESVPGEGTACHFALALAK